MQTNSAKISLRKLALSIKSPMSNQGLQVALNSTTQLTLKHSIQLEGLSHNLAPEFPIQFPAQSALIQPNLNYGAILYLSP